MAQGIKRRQFSPIMSRMKSPPAVMSIGPFIRRCPTDISLQRTNQGLNVIPSLPRDLSPTYDWRSLGKLLMTHSRFSVIPSLSRRRPAGGLPDAPHLERSGNLTPTGNQRSFGKLRMTNQRLVSNCCHAHKPTGFARDVLGMTQCARGRFSILSRDYARRCCGTAPRCRMS